MHGGKVVSNSFEQLNAQIDVWIDEEKYDQIESKFECNPELLLILDACFKHPHCTSIENIENADENWQKILITNKAKPVTFKNGSTIDEDWSKLFYAKLLRSKIQEKGTDCYFNRLDQVIAYLEKYIPDPYEGVESAKLAVLYQLELSAASLDYEMLGYAERARRLLENKDLKADKNFCSFYQLFARYNIGVAHFHLSNNSKAILEFNYIIFEINKLKDLDFYNTRKGASLLYLPAVIYRSAIQLKQQLAYHALKTLRRCSGELENEEHKYQRYKADLIKIRANQLMGEWREAGGLLRGLWEDLFKEKQAFPYFNKKQKMIHAKSFNADIPAGTDRQNIKGRLLSLAIDQHLNCLRRQTEILMQDDSEANNHDKALIKWVNNHSEYLKDLGRNSIVSYFSTVEFNKYDRNGYWEQVADYLRWLAGLMEVKVLKDNEKTLEKVRNLAGFCYESAGINKKRLIEYLFEKPPREDEEREWDCISCDPKGINLIRLESNHYDDFTERMLKVFEEELLNSKGEQKEEFINRLLKVEESRTDLRIKDLELRYESNEVKGELPPQQGSGREYCWPQISDETIRQFELLPCLLSEEKIKSLPEPVKQKSDLLPPHRRYEQVMERWDDYFLRHLESPSIHENQDPGLYFLGLQRWNSSSPAEGYSVGGGYLIYHLDDDEKKVSYGIAIDPGFDFIRNLFHMGFSLNDIDIVLISHAHIDHVRDFESIVTLFFELAKRKKQYRKVHVILTLGIYKRLEYIIENPKLRMHIEPYIIDIDREIETDYFENLPFEDSRSGGDSSFYFKLQPGNNISRFQALIRPQNDYTIRVRPTRAYHDDNTGDSDSFGFLIDVRQPGENKDVTIGYTGDTKWIYSEVKDPIKNDRISEQPRDIEDIIKQYQSCNTLIVHLGSLIKKNKANGKYNFLEYNQCNSNETTNPCEYLVRHEGHPYLIGLLRTLSSIYKSDEFDMPLVLLSEFGEELRGKIRVDLVERLIKVYGDKMQLLPVDVGINVQLKCESKIKKSDRSGLEKKVLCVQCNRLVPIGETGFEHYGSDEAIYCVCRTCLEGTPFDVLQNRLRQINEVGYELHPAK